MKRILSLFGMFGIVGWCVWCCGRIQSHSEIPEVNFKSLVFEDRIDTENNSIFTAVLTFSFIDGDGDIGSQDMNGASRIYYTWYQKLPDRTYVQHQFGDGTFTQSIAIPYDEVMNKDQANNKTLKGTIEIVLDTPTNIQNVDTMRVDFFIVDRATNPSIEKHTPDFSIQDPPTEPITK